MADLGTAGMLAAALDVRSGKAWVIGPGACVAAVPAGRHRARRPAGAPGPGEGSGGEPGRQTPAEPAGA